MHVEMSKCRVQLASNLDDENRQQQHMIVQPKRNFLQEACNWVFSNRWTPPVVSFNNTRFGAWGVTPSKALIQWFSETRWPNESSEPDSVGITWLELVAGFCHWTGILFPVRDRVPTSNSSFKYLQILTRHLFTTCSGLRWLSGLLSLLTRPVICVLRPLGRNCNGVWYEACICWGRLRIAVAWKCILFFLAKMWFFRFCLNMWHATIPVEIPPLPLQPTISLAAVRQDIAGNWIERSKKAHAGTLEIRKWRRCPQRQLSFTNSSRLYLKVELCSFTFDMDPTGLAGWGSRAPGKGQIIATSHDLTPKCWGREIPLFQGNLGWCKPNLALH